jgi:Flp pilus assembly protein TadD
MEYMKKNRTPSPSNIHRQATSPRESAIIRNILFSPVIHLFLIIVIGAVVYGNTFDVPFVLDDVTSIYGNPAVRDFKLAFRPRMVGDLSFALNYLLGGVDVTGYHLVNLLIHLINGGLVYCLVSLLRKSPFFPVDQGTDDYRLTPLFTALLFICHPVQTQAVTYISQRVASLATLFYLGTLVIWLAARYAATGKIRVLLYGAAFGTALLAMATKEIAFTLPLTLLVLEYIFFGGPLRRLAVPAALFSLAATMIPAAFIAATGVKGGLLEMLRRLATPTNVISRADYFLTQLRVQVTYLRLLIFPTGQNLDYDYPVSHTLFSLPVLASFALILAILFSAVYLLVQARRSEQPDLRLIGFGILWFFITLSVESSFIPLQDVIFEHRLYLPTVGLFVAFVTALMTVRRYLNNRKAAAGALVIPALILTVLLSAVTATARNEVWKDEITLWEDVVAKSPAKVRAHGSLGSAYQRRGLYDAAAREYHAAILLDQNDPANYNNLGTIYYLQKKWDDALPMYRKALSFDPKNVKAHYNLGTVLTKLGRYSEAESELLEVIRLKPDYDAAHNALGIVYAKLLRNGDAVAEFEKAARLNPGNKEAANNFLALSKAVKGEPQRPK